MPFVALSVFRSAARQIVFVNGEAANHVVSHNAMVVEALVDLQLWCDPLKVNNTQVIPFCSTYFLCGQTVVDQPRGIIRRLSTYDKIGPDAVENPNVDVNWCSEIIYHETNHVMLKRYVDKSLAFLGYPSSLYGCGCNSLLPALAPLVINFKNFTCGKTADTTYLQPTDEGFPQLPLGFHVGQKITDAQTRASRGVWAKHRGRIHLAPWIQSTETIVIEWDGLKEVWADADLVDNHPMLNKTVQSYLRWKHWERHEENPDKTMLYKQTYFDDRSDLICKYKMETRLESVTESHARGANLQLEANGQVDAQT